MWLAAVNEDPEAWPMTRRVILSLPEPANAPVAVTAATAATATPSQSLIAVIGRLD